MERPRTASQGGRRPHLGKPQAITSPSWHLQPIRELHIQVGQAQDEALQSRNVETAPEVAAAVAGAAAAVEAGAAGEVGSSSSSNHFCNLSWQCRSRSMFTCSLLHI